jgi:hypothetical protein
MKLTFTIDSALRNRIEGENGAELWDTYHLIRDAVKRGHDVGIVQSEDAVVGEGFSREFYLENGKEQVRDFGLPDILMIRGYGMRVGKQCFDNLVDTVGSIEGSIPVVVNSSRATAFSRKDRQKTLPLPFIPSYEVGGVSDVRSLLREHSDGLILKPVYGLMGAGVEYVANNNKLEELLRDGVVTEESLAEDYLAEKFIADSREVRYVSLFGESAGSRVAEKTGEPGKEVLGLRYLNENPNSKEVEIASKAMELTGIDYGCVDFRGGYVLEINGSGTQTFYRDKIGPEGKIFLELAPSILDGLEAKFKEKS